MNTPFEHALRVNPEWARLPLFDRKGWKRVRFGDVVENVNDTEHDPEVAGIGRFIGLEHLEPGSLRIRTWGNVADGTTFTRRCRAGQVLFGKRRAYQRKVAVAGFDAVVSGDIYVLAPKNDGLLLELLPFLCMSERFFHHAVGTSAGSLSPRTNWTSLGSFEFNLPPLDQQRRIAEILWSVDRLSAEKVQCRTATEDLRAAFLRESLDSLPASRVRFRSVQQLIAAGVIESPQDGNHGELHPTATDYVEHGIPFVMANDIRDHRLCLDTCKRISEQRARRLRIGFARPGDVLITHKGTIGLTAVVTPEAGEVIMLTPQVTYYRVKDPSRLRSDFLLAAFDSEQFQRQLMLRAKQSTRDYIGILAQRELSVVVPDRSDQDRIMEKLDAVDKVIRAVKTELLQLSRLAAKTITRLGA